jgi:hypothetical protein
MTVSDFYVQLDGLEPLSRRSIPSGETQSLHPGPLEDIIYLTMASTINYVGEQQFNQVVHAMLALATIFTIARACVQARRRHPMEPQDYLLYTGYILFLAMSVAMSMVSSKIFMIHRVRSHLISPPVTLKADLIWCVRMVYACNVMFLLSLWMVKLSFMALYKKLIKGLPGLYTQLWWGVMVFCLVVSSSSSNSYLFFS